MSTRRAWPTAVLALLGAALTAAAEPQGEALPDAYLDFGWRGRADVKALLRGLEAPARAGQRFEVLVHGDDLGLFSKRPDSGDPRVAALARRLAETGAVDFRVCEHALRFEAMELEDLPAFFEPVYYVPERIEALRRRAVPAFHD